MSRLAVGLALLACAAAARTEETVRDGAAITPEVAETLYARVGRLGEPDRCRVTRFDTGHYRITIGLAAPGGAEQFFDVATTPGLVPVSRSAGDWAIAVPAPLARDCPSTVAAIERILAETAAPTGGWHVGSTEVSASWPYVLLAATLVVLVVGTLVVLRREARVSAPPAGVVAALVVLWAFALGLRLWLSPRTFLHEYYHIADTVPAYLSGEVTPGYGKTGPALFRLVGRLLGRPEDLYVIFLTNAVVSSLAVPAAAMLVLEVVGSWGQAVCVALLLAVLPAHLRFSAAEDLFVQAITFGMWSLALFASYARTWRIEDALLGAVAASLATQARPEMILFPVVVLAFLLCIRPRVLFARSTLVAGVVLALLLVPHALDVLRAMREARSPAPRLPSAREYFHSLVFFDPRITPILYPAMLALGAAWAAVRRPGWLVWNVAVYVAFTLFAMSMFNNPPYRLRAQNLPTTHLVLVSAGAVPVWMAAWRRRRQIGVGLGVAVLAVAAIGIVTRWRGFIGELKDQQLEWTFLERHVSDLPAKGTLITAVETGGANLDAFPEFLLTGSGRRYALVDVRRAAEGAVGWPEARGDVLFYQGMFCYFAFHDDEPTPAPMTRACRAVHERYTAEPVVVEDLRTEGYSPLRYAEAGSYRIGFYRLRPRT